jgi:hypothetical protein
LNDPGDGFSLPWRERVRVRGQKIRLFGITAERRVGKLIAPRPQERKEKFLLTCPNLAAFAPLREIF